MSLPSIDLSVSQRLKADPEFRQRFFIAESSAEIARQLITLRKRRDLSQTELAKKMGTRQPAISRVESSDYLNWSFNTLRKFAEALDARLRVIIEPAEDVLREYDDEKEQPAEPLPDQKIEGQNTILPVQEDRGRVPDHPGSAVDWPLKAMKPPQPYEQMKRHDPQV